MTGDSERWTAAVQLDDGMTTTSRDRAVGALVGLAVGDAIGATLEFCQPGTFEPIDDMTGGGPHRLLPGQWTDDTSMAMCLAESILDRGDLDPADRLRRYVAWREHGYWSSKDHCFDIGFATADALERFRRTGAVTDEQVDQEKAANGSLMRLAPVPIRWFTDVARAAEMSGRSSTTTHAADRPVDACRLYGAMIAALIAGRDPREVLDSDFWNFGRLDPAVESIARGSWRKRQPPDIRGGGYVVDALEAALWAVDGASDFAGAVLRAANLGDDADTTAAIAGQLAGARWGVRSIPLKWRNLLFRGERIAAIAGLLHDSAVGAPVDASWVHDPVLHAYWVDPGRVLAGEYPGRRDDERATIDKLNLLVDNGVRTIIDLTHPGDHMDPYLEPLDEVVRHRSLDIRHVPMPIPDMGTVHHDRYDQIAGAITEGAGRGAVYVHCWGGIGRTGTVVACLLVDSGMSGTEALDRLDELRSTTRKADVSAPQTPEQVRIVMERAQRARHDPG